MFIYCVSHECYPNVRLKQPQFKLIEFKNMNTVTSSLYDKWAKEHCDINNKWKMGNGLSLETETNPSSMT